MSGQGSIRHTETGRCVLSRSNGKHEVFFARFSKTFREGFCRRIFWLAPLLHARVIATAKELGGFGPSNFSIH